MAPEEAAAAAFPPDAPQFAASAYLRAREVAVMLRPAPDADPEPVWVHLTNLEVARLEEEFGGQAAFDKEFEDSPQRTMRRFLAIALGSDTPIPKPTLEVISQRMVDTEWPAYAAAVETLWYLAHGGNEVGAGKLWAGKVLLAEQGVQLTVAITEEAVKITTRTSSRGANGSKRGRGSVARSASSGA